MKFRHEHVLVVFVAVFILVGLMLLAADTVYAGIEDGGYGADWDYVAGYYRHSNVQIPNDGGWSPFYYKLDRTNPFDTYVWPDDYIGPLPGGIVYNPCYPLSPTEPSSTTWAGYIEVFLGHVDDVPAGGAGFQETRNWSLYYCDRDGNGIYEGNPGGDDGVFPPDFITPVTGCTVRVINQDVENPCSWWGGPCSTSINSEMIVNCDTNCDDSPEEDPFPDPGGGLCLYFEARRPTAADPLWGGNLQCRLRGGAGSQTWNHSVLDTTTAVTLASFGAHTAAAPYVALVLGLGIGGVILLRWHARRKKPPEG